MRTTLEIDDDVLLAAKAIAGQSRKSLGKVVSEMARQALKRPPPGQMRNGIPLLADGKNTPVTLAEVNALRDEVP
jgi:hypothetical protein